MALLPRPPAVRLLGPIVTRRADSAGLAGGMAALTPRPQRPRKRCSLVAKGEATRRLTPERVLMEVPVVAVAAGKRLRLERAVVLGRL